MPLLSVSYDFSKTDTQSLNEAKQKISKMGISDLSSVSNIASRQTTRSNVNAFYRKVITYLNSIYKVIERILNSSVAIDDVSLTKLTENTSNFETSLQFEIPSQFNYMDSFQVRDIKNKLISLEEIRDIMITVLIDNIRNGHAISLIVQNNYNIILNFYATNITPIIILLNTAIQNYEPFKLQLNPSSSLQEQSQEQDLIGGYIVSGGSRNRMSQSRKKYFLKKIFI